MEGYIAEIRLFAADFSPKYWSTCDGQTLSIAQNQALFALLGTTYGGDGVTTFRLPDFRGRAAIEPGQSQGTSYYSQGQIIGTPTVTLVSANLPAHTHAPNGVPTASITPRCKITEGDNPEPAGLFPAAGITQFAPGPPTGTMHGITATAQSTIAAAVNGGSQPIPLTPPYLAVNYIICMYGIFPSRN